MRGKEIIIGVAPVRRNGTGSRQLGKAAETAPLLREMKLLRGVMIMAIYGHD